MNWISQAALAVKLKCDRRTVSDYIHRGIIEKGERGRVDENAAIPALFAHLREIAAGRSSGNEKYDLVTERARESKERADKLALENATTRGHLLPSDSVSWFMAQRAAAYKSRSRSLATKARSLLGLDAKQSKAMLELIDDGLRALAAEELPEGTEARLESDWATALDAAGSDT